MTLLRERWPAGVGAKTMMLVASALLLVGEGRRVGATRMSTYSGSSGKVGEECSFTSTLDELMATDHAVSVEVSNAVDGVPAADDSCSTGECGCSCVSLVWYWS